MLPIDICRELILDSEKLSDEQVVSIRADLYEAAELALESYFKSLKTAGIPEGDTEVISKSWLAPPPHLFLVLMRAEVRDVDVAFLLDCASNVLHDAEHWNSRLTQALFFVTQSEG